MRRSTYAIYGKVLCLAAALWSAALTVSCITDKTDDGRKDNTPDAEAVQVKMILSIPGMDSAITRADDGIGSLRVMTFDEDGFMTDAPQAATASDGQVGGKYYVAMLNATDEFRRVLIIVNAADELDAYEANTGVGFPGGEWRVLGEDGVTEANATKLSHLAANLRSVDLPSKSLGGTLYSTGQPDDEPPMAGSVDLSDGIDVTTVISNSYEDDGVTPKPIMLTRAVAKLTVEIDASVSDFVILGATLGHAPTGGYVMPQTTIVPWPVLRNYANEASTNEGSGYRPIVAAENARLSMPLYSYESDGEQHTGVVVYASYLGVPGYYHMAVVDGQYSDGGASRRPLDVVRNKWYRIGIHKAVGYGYPTFTEAINNPPANLEYEVTADLQWPDRDDDPHDIVSNGNYYMGVSNSSFIAYSDVAAPSGTLVAASLTHNAPIGVTTGTITVEGMGLTIVQPLSAGFTGSATSLSFNPSQVGKTFDIPVAMDTRFGYNTAGSITIKVGNLQKRIAVRRRASLPILAGVTELATTGNEWVYATIAADNPTPDWLELSDTENGPGTTDKLHTSTGRVYIRYDRNVEREGAVPRDAGLFLSKGDGEGRTKVFLHQKHVNLDEIEDDRPPAGFTPYVGAFWKNNQTGERLIRIMRPTGTNAANADGEWMAMVIEGDDWITIDDSPSTDPNVLTINVPHTYGNTSDFDTQHAVTGDNDMVTGVLGAAKPEVYFRVGLKSTNPGSTPRYGVVLFYYGNLSKVQRIFIRQGEAPDYVMRPEEPGTSLINRPNAVMFSPYNIKDPQHRIPDHRNNANIITQGGGRWVEYPSMIGYSYTFNTNFAVPPKEGLELTGMNGNERSTAWWNANSFEACPAIDGHTYRRPTDGSINIAGGDRYSDSEIRQSLWLNPQNGSTSNANNSLGGYYADGYFDRQRPSTLGNRHIVHYNPGGIQNVSDDWVLAASTGRLFFNPATNASVFLPASGAGDESNSNFIFGQVGAVGMYWTSTSYTAQGGIKNGSVLNFSSDPSATNSVVQILRDDNANFHPVRCVTIP